MNREGGQALVEVVAAIPVCMVAAGALVDGGLIVRDRLMVAEAASRGAAAAIRGEDAVAAATSATSRELRRGLEVQVRGDRVVVRATSAPRFVRVPGGITHRSEARVSVEDVR